MISKLFDQARALELAMQNNESYNTNQPLVNAAVSTQFAHSSNVTEQSKASTLAAMEVEDTCFFCGNAKHPRSKCPARDVICLKCQKKGHFAKVCRGKPANSKSKISAAAWSPSLATVPSTLTSLSMSSAIVHINGLRVKALFDSGSSESFIHPGIVKDAFLTVQPSSSKVSMATLASSAKISGTCVVDLTYQGQTYKGFSLSVLPELCADPILGIDFQSQHESVVFQYGGLKPPVSVCSFSKLNVEPPEPFSNLTSDCHPIATKSRRYSRENSEFIDKEVTRLLEEGIIEPSQSPW